MALAERVSTENTTDLMAILAPSPPAKIPAPLPKGLRLITPDSAGSNAIKKPGIPSETTLISSICKAVITGHPSPSRTKISAGIDDDGFPP